MVVCMSGPLLKFPQLPLMLRPLARGYKITLLQKQPGLPLGSMENDNNLSTISTFTSYLA